MTQRRTIESFGLVRSDRGFTRPLDAFLFLVPFSGPHSNPREWREWQFRRIVLPGLVPGSPDIGDLHRYAYNSTKKIYVLFDIFLVDDGVRLTKMWLSQMLQDCWMESGNRNDSLRYLGIDNIVNETVQELITQEWAHRGREGEDQQHPFGTPTQKMITLTPSDSITWARNTFIQAGVRLAAMLSTHDRILTCKKAHLIKRGRMDLMVLEFDNGDSEQDRGAMVSQIEAGFSEAQQRARIDGGYRGAQ